ncbi:MAG: riboflavin kinase [Pseudomonadota bacterium]
MPIHHVITRRLPPCVLAVSDFDGMHAQHRALLERAREQARTGRLSLAALVLAPARRARRTLGNLRDTLQALRSAGVDHVLVRRAGSDASAALMASASVRRVVAADDPASLARASALVADALVRADFATLRSLQGQAFLISGHVVHGRKLGRTMGFPTLNVRLRHGPCELRGIYVVRVHGLAPGPLRAVASVGVRPTVEQQGEPLLEVHVLESIAPCYGKIVSVEFLTKLRDEARFADLGALEAAIAGDVRAAATYFERAA